MKPAGPLRGLQRAIDHSILFIRSFYVVGLPLLFAFSLWERPREFGDLFAALIVAHLLGGLLIFPGATLTNFIALRLARPRSWRNEAWRSWIAGTLAVPFCWIGPLLAQFLVGSVPTVFFLLFGEMSGLVFLGSLVLPCSTLSLLVAWIWPGGQGVRRRRRSAEILPSGVAK